MSDKTALVVSAHAADFVARAGGQSSGRNAKCAEGFQSIFPLTVDELR